MIYCQKCKTQNDPTQDRCNNCGADLLPAEGIKSRLRNLYTGLIMVLILAIPAYFIFRMETPHPILKWIGYLLIAVIVVLFYFTITTTISKTQTYERYALRARHHMKLDTQQSIADFSKALEFAPQTERISLLTERATIFENLGMKPELVSDWNEIMSLVPVNERIKMLRRRAVVFEDLGMTSELVSDWDEILSLTPANERIEMLRKRAAVFEKFGIVQKFNSYREESLTRRKPDEEGRVNCKISGAPILIPQSMCVFCGCPIEKESQAFVTASAYGDKQSLSFKFPLCTECDEFRTSEVNSAVKISNFKEKNSATLIFYNLDYAKAFFRANS